MGYLEPFSLNCPRVMPQDPSLLIGVTWPFQIISSGPYWHIWKSEKRRKHASIQSAPMDSHVLVLEWFKILFHICMSQIICIHIHIPKCLKEDKLLGIQAMVGWHQTQRHYSISQEICTRFLLCCALLWLYIDWFSHIHQAYFTGTVAI